MSPRRSRIATSHYPAQQVFQHQADAYVTQASAVSGTKYEWSSDGTQTNKLGAQKNVRIISIAANDDWSADTTSMEVHVTIDGVALVYTVDPNDDTWYFPDMLCHLAEASGVLGTADRVERAFLFEGRSVKIEVESTGGTSDSLQMRVKWAKIP